MNIIFIWIGNPKPHLRRFWLAAGAVFWKTNMFCFAKGMFLQKTSVWSYLMIRLMFENTK